MSFRDWLKKQMEPGPPDPTWDPRGHDKWHIQHGEPFEPASSIGTEYLKAQSHCGTPDPAPERELPPKPPRQWKIREGHGFTIGTATEITNTLTGDKLIQVTWEDDLVPPMRRPDRETWIDIAALDNSLNNTHPDGFRRRHQITGPVRIQWISRGDWHEDVAMDEDD